MIDFFQKKKIYKDIPDYKLLDSYNLDWSDYIAQYNLNSADPIEHYLANWPNYRLIIPGIFDSKVYLEINPDIKNEGVNPLIHFLKYGKYESRIAFKHITPDTSSHNDDYNLLKLCREINWEQYKETFAITDDPIEHYLENWLTVNPVFPGFFDSYFYIHEYDDIRKSNINPLVHFLRHGIFENRSGIIDTKDYIFDGSKIFDSSKQTIFIVSHQASRTGAPLIALALSDSYLDEFNIINVALSSGDLELGELDDEFKSRCFKYIKFPYIPGFARINLVIKTILKVHSINAAIVSSVECRPFIESMVFNSIPIVSLIHEYPDYTRPRDKIPRALMESDIVVFPSENLMLSALKNFHEILQFQQNPNNLLVKAQGYIDLFKDTSNSETCFSIRELPGIEKSDIIICGAGQIHTRKGVDWFLEVCAYIDKITESKEPEKHPRLKYIWLGGGYDQEDMIISVWFDVFLERTGIKHKFYFPGTVTSVSDVLSSADIFLLTSRLDPFPNVAIEALNADCGIACFENASGTVDIHHKTDARMVTAPYGDVYGLATEIIENMDFLMNKNGVNKDISRSYFDFGEYAKFILNAVDIAKERHELVAEASKLPEFRKQFDESFYGMSYHDKDSDRHFLTLLLNNLVIKKPFPGSEIQSKLTQEPIVADESYIQRIPHLMENSENVYILKGVPNQMFNLNVAIHFHIYYPELIHKYCEYFGILRDLNVDLFVSHVPQLTEYDIEILQNSVSGNVSIKQVENIGRNVYPLHMLLNEIPADKYDLLGHFHTKKSIDISQETADRWRNYLLENLIGTKELVTELFSLFLDTKIGLIYAEDNYCVNEGQNMAHIAEISQLLSIPVKDHYFYFPVGNMFWFRPDALGRLNDLPGDIFKIREPVPYDGSMLHAFERIIPTIVENAGYTSLRIHVRGTHR